MHDVYPSVSFNVGALAFAFGLFMLVADVILHFGLSGLVSHSLITVLVIVLVIVLAGIIAGLIGPTT